MTPTLQTLISLDRLHCHNTAEILFSDEPYLWTAFVKVDGDTLVLDLIGDRPDAELTEEDLYLRGRCSFVAGSGSHGNLGVSDVDEGEDVAIPSTLGDLPLGEFGGTLKPIPLTDRAKQKLRDRFPEISIPDAVNGTVAVVVVLADENSLSDAAAEAGHATFKTALERELNGFLFQEGDSIAKEDLEGKLGFVKRELSPEDKARIKAKVKEAVEDAIVSSSGGGLVDPDAFFDAQFFTADSAQLVKDAVQEIYVHLQLFEPNSQGTVVVGDYKLSGDILGIEPDGVGYESLRRSHEYGTPAASGAPTALVIPALGVQNIVYGDTDGYLHELWRDGAGQTGTTNLTVAAGAGTPLAAGNPYVYRDTTTGKVVALYRDKDDSHIHDLYWSTGVPDYSPLSARAGAPEADSNPVGYFIPATNTHHVVYRSDRDLHVLYWSGDLDPVHYEGSLTAAADNAPKAEGDPSAYLDTTRGTNIIVYRGTDRHIHLISWTGAETPHHEDLSGACGAPDAEGDPVAGYSQLHDAHGVVYRAGDGRLIELYWPGNNPVQFWVPSAEAPPAVSDPVAFNNLSTNTRHLIYRSTNDHLYELSWVPGGGTPVSVDLTLMGLARRAVDRPAAFTVEGPNTYHVIYRSADNEIREIRWPTNPWANPGSQPNWRWCPKCQGLFYGGNTAASRCPAGGSHTPSEQSASFDYILAYGAPAASSNQRDWRWCNKCQGLFYGGNLANSRCPTGGTHTPPEQSGSADYNLPHGAPTNPSNQPDWRWCNRCQGLFYGGNAASSRCPAGGRHTPPGQSGSADYNLAHTGVLL
jgi:hypothetical protein